MKSPHQFNFIFIHREPADMRREMNSLCDIVAGAAMGEVTGKNLFVFTGKRRTAIKIFYFDKSGFCLGQKRLEQDRFPWPKKVPDEVVRITSDQLTWLLDGYDVWKMKPFTQVNFERVS